MTDIDFGVGDVIVPKQENVKYLLNLMVLLHRQSILTPLKLLWQKSWTLF